MIHSIGGGVEDDVSVTRVTSPRVGGLQDAPPEAGVAGRLVLGGYIGFT